MSKPPFPETENCTIFPSHENMYFEFKRNLQTFNTLSKAICGMLNRKGGYIVFGIDDLTHKICGIANNKKLIDEFALYIDKIIGQKQILTNANEALDPDNIMVELVPHSVGLLVVLNIRPVEGIQYKMRDGCMYVRLNASTWDLKKEEALYRETDVKHIIDSKASQLNKYKRMTQNKIIKLNAEYEELDQSNYILTKYLFQTILQEKVKAEKELLRTNCSGIFYSISSIFCCV
jgi:predicted HTH transcriptional regulator